MLPWWLLLVLPWTKRAPTRVGRCSQAPTHGGPTHAELSVGAVCASWLPPVQRQMAACSRARVCFYHPDFIIFEGEGPACFNNTSPCCFDCCPPLLAVSQYPTEEMKRVLGDKIGLTAQQVGVSTRCGGEGQAGAVGSARLALQAACLPAHALEGNSSAFPSRCMLRPAPLPPAHHPRRPPTHAVCCCRRCRRSCPALRPPPGCRRGSPTAGGRKRI